MPKSLNISRINSFQVISKMVFNKIKDTVSRGDNIAVFVDGPNVVRKEFDLDLDE